MSFATHSGREGNARCTPMSSTRAGPDRPRYGKLVLQYNPATTVFSPLSFANNVNTLLDGAPTKRLQVQPDPRGSTITHAATAWLKDKDENSSG